jgi:hypothetical protein
MVSHPPPARETLISRYAAAAERVVDAQRLQEATMTVHDMIPPLIVNPEEDRQHELELAQRAVTYLATQGLERRAVIACLVDEFDLDEATAEELASLAA